MRLLLITVLLASALAAPRNGYDPLEIAKDCDPNACKLPNCLCPSTLPPKDLNRSQIPQLVLLTFDDAVGVLNSQYYNEAFDGRKNPDGCPIGSTYFVSHDYTDYSVIHSLWARGHEIALHSITHRTPIDVWKNLTEDEHRREFADEATLVSEFAQIPKNDIQGIRIPFLQLSGNSSFEMIKNNGLKYDASWPTQSYIKSGLFPYTLDYKSFQDCSLPPCPTAAIPGVWVVPMVDWTDIENQACAMVDSCRVIPTDEEELVDWMIGNFERHYNGSRSPFGFYVHAAWFDGNPVRFAAYKKFLDYLQGVKDVYLVSVQRALQWMQNPSTVENLKNSWPSCQPVRSNTCAAHTCQLKKGENEERWMTHCKEGCPAVYPWIDDPLGEGK